MKSSIFCACRQKIRLELFHHSLWIAKQASLFRNKFAPNLSLYHLLFWLLCVNLLDGKPVLYKCDTEDELWFGSHPQLTEAYPSTRVVCKHPLYLLCLVLEVFVSSWKQTGIYFVSFSYFQEETGNSHKERTRRSVDESVLPPIKAHWKGWPIFTLHTCNDTTNHL